MVYILSIISKLLIYMYVLTIVNSRAFFLIL